MPRRLSALIIIITCAEIGVNTEYRINGAEALYIACLQLQLVPGTVMFSRLQKRPLTAAILFGCSGLFY